MLNKIKIKLKQLSNDTLISKDVLNDLETLNDFDIINYSFDLDEKIFTVNFKIKISKSRAIHKISSMFKKADYSNIIILEIK